MTEQIVSEAIDATLQGEKAYCKFMSANDSGETGGHQVGFLVSKSAREIMFTEDEVKKNHIFKRNVKIRWHNDFCTDSCFTWYESKNELRITRFGRGFPFISPEYTGALFVLVQNTRDDYDAFILNTEDEIQTYLDNFGLTPAETNRLVEVNAVSHADIEKKAFARFIGGLVEEFPASKEMSVAAQNIFYQLHLNSKMAVENPDRILLEWTEEEYRLFRAIEHDRYGERVASGFTSVDDFVIMANKVLNRRKSRAGKSLEHHLSAIFDRNEILYTAQAVTEGNKKPDFIFPSEEAYHDVNFAVEKLCTLAAKTTCKDRWRQVLNEADRLRDDYKYLCTLQQGISAAQMDEMQAEKVILEVPQKYISTYPRDRQDRIWTLKKFVNYVREMEGLA